MMKTPTELLKGKPRTWTIEVNTSEGVIRTVARNERTHIVVERPTETPAGWGLSEAWANVVDCLMDGRTKLKGIEHLITADMIPVRKGSGEAPRGINLPSLTGLDPIAPWI